MLCLMLRRTAAAVSASTVMLGLLAVAPAGHSGKDRRSEILATQKFCGGLGEAITLALSESATAGMDIAPAHILALQNRLLKELRNESGASFIDVAAMTPESPGSKNNSPSGVLPLAKILGPAMGLGQQVLLAYSFEELKYLPFTQMGSQILLIATEDLASQSGRLNSQKMKLVQDTAVKLNVKISVLDLSGTKTPAGELADLASLIASTGGKIVAVDAAEQACGRLL